jgi:FlaA1/EpsC-like NDP-sugar epimerase
VLALPRLDELVGGQLSVRDIRDLGIEDLIGRQLVETDLTDVAALLLGRRVLVTGAGGSIGAEIVRQISSFGHGGLFALDNDETHLHDLAVDVAEDADVVLLLADIRDSREIARIFELYRPEVVFHAAAHKHVPMLEIHPQEAVKTNIVGTMNVAEAALHAGVERFILISTDKAIQPVSIMGITKLLSERVIRSLDGRGCRFTSVRFGNVVGSRGSVVPTFMRQIAHGGPVTVTDPEMTRYFMSISEAVQLVLQAAALARGGEVFTLDAGAPINILTLARRLIRLAGRVPDRDVPIAITGVRPGERLTENLMSRVEHSEPTQHPQIVRSSPQPQGNARLRADIQQLMGLVEDTDTAGVRDLLQEIGDRESTPTEAVGADLVAVD